jgi:hypothetical protein
MKGWGQSWLGLRRLREEFEVSEIFGLRCDLAKVPEVRPAKLPTRMEPMAPSSGFIGFEEELSRVKGRAYIDVLVRAKACKEGINTLFVAHQEGAPTYAQWLVTPADQVALHRFEPNRYPQLGQNEVLLEWAYTFVRFRRLGLMNEGMHQLLAKARSDGYASAVTYVGAENVASLRGCANVGFVLDHVRRNSRRWGRAVTSVTNSPNEDAQARWRAAIGSRAA